MRRRERMPTEFRTTLRDRAREMRKTMSAAEVKLWSLLRGDQFMGLRFRRQHVIGPYVVDFFCNSANLVIELDGDSHADSEQVQRDMDRTDYLHDHGLRVIRFSNYEVLTNIDSVLAAIAKATAT
jgi:5-methyltetrahydrofolate--homocysteine methyltransferase